MGFGDEPPCLHLTRFTPFVRHHEQSHTSTRDTTIMKSRNIVSVFFFVHFFGNAWGNTLFDKVERRQNPNSGAINYNPNGTEFIWLLEDTYQGKTFFE